MKIKELIQELEKYDENMKVMIEDTLWEWVEVATVKCDNLTGEDDGSENMIFLFD